MQRYSEINKETNTGINTREQHTGKSGKATIKKGTIRDTTIYFVL